jgi:hypothetical protein
MVTTASVLSKLQKKWWKKFWLQCSQHEPVGEQVMEQQSVGQTVADLTEALAIQAEVAHDRLALEWGYIVVTRLLNVWKQLEAHDAMAYEDKVAAQVHILDEATSSLWHLHRTLVRTHRTLKTHQQQLKQTKHPISAA